MKYALIALLVLLSAPAKAQEASADAFAYCSALAQASADHQLNIAKDENAAKAMQLVADGYRAAALIKAAETMNAAEDHVQKTIDSRKAHYASELTNADDVPAMKFESDVSACKLVEPQAYKLIDDFNKKHAAEKPATE